VRDTPLQAYQLLLADSVIKSDSNQAGAMERLQALDDELSNYGKQMGKTGWPARLSFA